MFVDVAPLTDLAEAAPLVVKVDRREIVLVRWNGEVYALRNMCPHQHQSFETGVVRGQFCSDTVGEIVTDGDRAAIACPWHRWQFDLSSGDCLGDSSYRVRSYETRVEDGRILVDVGGRGRRG